MFIVLDGIDCCGKDTQIELLSKWLKPQLIIQCPNRETQTGAIIDSFLDGTTKLHRMAQIALFEANRWEWCDVVTSALKKNGTVLANRWFQSGMAYALGSGERYLEAASALTVGLPQPDLSIIIDISVGESVRRKKNRDAFEGDNDFLSRVREGFLKLSTSHGWLVVDGEKAPSEVFATIQHEIQTRQSSMKAC
ncbi:MAG: dTMP kinase [Nitrososphaerales archaeon]|jgi:dTMP kinase